MADQGDEWASPSGDRAAEGARPAPEQPPRYGERIPGWTPPAEPVPSAAPGGSAQPGGYAAPGASPQPGAYPQPGAGYTPPPKPGLIPLHPLSFGELLGASFGVLRYNTRATVLPTLLINVIQVVVSLGLFGVIGFSAYDRISHASDANRGAIIAGSIAEGALGGLVIAAISVFGTAILQGMLVLVVARGALGERPRAGEALRRAMRSFWPLVGFGVLVAAVEIVAILVLVLLVVGVAGAGSVGLALAILIGVLGGLGYLVAAGFLIVKLATVPSAIVLERLGVFAAIGRSWTLLRGAFWKTFGIFALLLVIIYFASQLVSVPFSFLGTAIGGLLFPDAGSGSTDPTTAIPVLLITTVPAAILSTIVQGIGQIAQVSAFALVYLDRRIRREGLDLDLQRAVEQGGADPFEPAPR
ncbi:MAG TPA: hypothetical protein VIG76_06895 [Amnibacterium sp.]|jgi:hypothetical protein|uniref:hypothetical protein n=1 Tax=Amnibacterium sp. TaxID=1872496 RepID=UPI002F923CCD